jgi:hypothetical protein
LDEKKLGDAMKVYKVDLLFFGSFEPHGHYTTSDTAKVYYKWAANTFLTPDIKQVNTNPAGYNILSLNEVKQGKNQDNYTFIINFCLARLYALEYINNNDRNQLKKSIHYLDKALNSRYDAEISYVTTLGHQLIDEKAQLIAYLENKVKTEHNQILKAYNDFLLAKTKKDDSEMYAAAYRFHEIMPKDSIRSIYISACREVMEFLVVYAINFKDEATTLGYLTDFANTEPDQERPFLYLAGFSGMRNGIDAEIGSLKRIFLEHTGFKFCKRFLAACYYFRSSHGPFHKRDSLLAKELDSNIENDFKNRYEVDTSKINGQQKVFVEAMTPLDE